MALLGEDGRGYELARKLESQGVWRMWLGDSLYSAFIPFLSSPAAWDAFMRPDDSKTKPHINLQLRARALLFDKASVCLFDAQFPIQASIPKLNPNYLELHGDDVYFTLESSSQDGDQRQKGFASNTTSAKGNFKTSGVGGSRISESEVDVVSKKFKMEEWPETWYTQFLKKYKASNSYRLKFEDKESDKRTPEQMSMYLKVRENHQRRRLAYKDNVPNLQTNLIVGDSNGIDDSLLLPETMFTLNCVPDNAVLQTSSLENNQKVPFNGVYDNLPQIMTKSPAISPIMIERLGIRPEYLNMEQVHQAHRRGGYQSSGKLLGEEQALMISQKVVVRLLSVSGFESSSDSSLGVLGQFLSCHISKLGCILKLLSDSYKKQCSAMELIKMFLHSSGYSNLAALSELTKDNTKNVVQPQQQQQQQAIGIQTQLQVQQQPSLQQPQQILRQMSPHTQQLNNPQYLAFQQQQWERMRRQQSTPRPGIGMSTNANNVNMDKDRPLVQVKMENPSDFPLDTNAFAAMNARHPLQHLRQQQLAAISSLHAQANQNTFRPVTTLPIPKIQSPNTIVSRAPPVKVEGFQELMGVDSSMKHDTGETELLSPQH